LHAIPMLRVKKNNILKLKSRKKDCESIILWIKYF
jgi:hypothetical protein